MDIAGTARRNAAIRVAAKAADPDALDAALHLTEIDPPRDLPAGSAVIEIGSAGVNPSDVRAVLGAMPYAVWPRTPGRDYAGVVVQGPPHLLGKEVWGSGGDLGIRRDGSHARHLVLPAANLREKPAAITLAEAGAVGQCLSARPRGGGLPGGAGRRAGARRARPRAVGQQPAACRPCRLRCGRGPGAARCRSPRPN